MLAAKASPRRASAAPPPADLEPRVAELVERYLELWRRTPTDDPAPGPRTTPWRRWRSARRARRLVDWLAAQVERYPESGEERDRWRQAARERVQRFGEEALGWPRGYRDLLFADEFFDATAAFARAGRDFDPEVRAEDLGQALRNVWIMNSLQMLFDLPVELTPPIFAYSMLYPYTDNLLDDPTVSAVAKRRFNHRLGQRLRGEAPTPESRCERQVWRLVERIERRFPRAAHPEAYGSLLAIHRAQIASLAQQDPAVPPGEEELLRITFRKGGSSVLPDGYLLSGALGPAELDFCFGYGVFLQLLDDLQDVAADRAAGHRTLFSTHPRPLDRPTARLHHFMDAVLGRARVFDSPQGAGVRDLIRRNCALLLVGAVAEQAEDFSPPFRRRLTRRWPMSLRAMRRLRRRLELRARETRSALERERGVDSLLDLMD